MKDPLVSIGKIAARTGMAVSAIRFYEGEGLLPAIRNAGGHRLFPRSTIRRVSFILIAQNMGYTLDEIKGILQTLPDHRTPLKSDWRRLSLKFSKDLDEKIAAMEQLKHSLSACIGCGCLSLKSCRLYNPGDQADQLGAGPRYLLGDKPPRPD